jgi:L,D-transpeptidase YcbB
MVIRLPATAMPAGEYRPEGIGRSVRPCFTVFVLAICIACFLTGPLPRPCRAGNAFFPLVRARIERLVQAEINKQGFSCRGERICGLRIIPSFYRSRNFEPVWFDNNGLRPTAQPVMESIAQAAKDGLNPSDYHQAAIEQLWAELAVQVFPPEASQATHWADFDLILTDAFLLLGSHLSGGRIDPETLHSDWLINERSIDMLALLQTPATRSQMEKAIQALSPAHAGYVGLKAVLQRMRKLEINGGWPEIQGPGALKPGDKSDIAALVRKRMLISGDLAPCSPTEQPPPEAPDLYDEALAAAIRGFQRRHGLAADGVIGKKTRAALNVTAAQRVRQIELNLERWRWLPRHLGDRYIEVNTADFNLRVMERSRKVLFMRVVVGRPARRTPVFSTTMSYMVLNPYWNVPRTIAVEDILPKLADNVDYLAEQRIKVFAGWQEDAPEVDPHVIPWQDYNENYFPLALRQDPGGNNALGRIKFIFPNKFAIFLHDTPQRSLFERVQRDFSSGCIRLENARALANYLLADDPAWTPDKLQKIFDSGRRQVVRIPRPIALHLLYMTAWVDESGTLQFRNDIYGRDAKLNIALLKRRPYPLPIGDPE